METGRLIHIHVPQLKVQFWLPGSFDEPKGEYSFTYLWTDPEDRYLRKQNAIYILKRLVRTTPMGSYFKIFYQCPFEKTMYNVNTDRKNLIKRLVAIRDSIITGVPEF